MKLSPSSFILLIHWEQTRQDFEAWSESFGSNPNEIRTSDGRNWQLPVQLSDVSVFGGILLISNDSCTVNEQILSEWHLLVQTKHRAVGIDSYYTDTLIVSYMVWKLDINTKRVKPWVGELP